MAAQATVICVISEGAVPVCREVDDRAANVHHVAPDQGLGEEQRRELWREAQRKPPVYSLVPFDPLTELVEAWAARLVGEADRLELAIGLAGGLELPDYYLVDNRLVDGGPADPHRAWYFEFLYSRAPRRVVAFDGTADGLIRALRELPTGPALPAVAALAEGARGFVPGTTGLAAPAPSKVM